MGEPCDQPRDVDECAAVGRRPRRARRQTEKAREAAECGFLQGEEAGNEPEEGVPAPAAFDFPSQEPARKRRRTQPKAPYGRDPRDGAVLVPAGSAGAGCAETLAAAEPGETVVFDLPAEIWERIALCLSSDINPLHPVAMVARDLAALQCVSKEVGACTVPGWKAVNRYCRGGPGLAIAPNKDKIDWFTIKTKVREYKTERMPAGVAAKTFRLTNAELHTLDGSVRLVRNVLNRSAPIRLYPVALCAAKALAKYGSYQALQAREQRIQEASKKRAATLAKSGKAPGRPAGAGRPAAGPRGQMFVIDFGDFYDPHEEAHHYAGYSDDDPEGYDYHDCVDASMDYQLRDDYSDVYDYDDWCDEQWARMEREGGPRRSPTGARVAAAAQQGQQQQEASASAAGSPQDVRSRAAAAAAAETAAETVAAQQQGAAHTPQQQRAHGWRRWCSPTFCGDC